MRVPLSAVLFFKSNYSLAVKIISINFLSLLSQIIGVISEIPISLAFSKNHSNLSFDLRGDITTCNE